jgi:hypothetical protein
VAGLPDTGNFSVAQISSDPQFYFANNLGLPGNILAAAGITDGTDTSLFASASTVAGTNQASAGSNAGGPAWAGSYWADTVTLTGGTGTGDVAFHLSLSGSITGNGSVRYRYSLATPFAAFPFNGSTDPNTDFSGNPYPDLPTAFDMLYNGTSFGTVTAAGGYGFGIEIDTGLDYGTTYMFQVFLETSSSDGGVADFTDPGHFDSINIPFDSNVIFGSGNTDVNVTAALSPEPGAGLLVIPAMVGLIALRRRMANRA